MDYEYVQLKINDKGEWEIMKKKQKPKAKPKKITEAQKMRKLLREMRTELNFLKDKTASLEYSHEQITKRYEERLKDWDTRYQSLSREKEQHYRESNQKTAKISRLEGVVASLRDGAQKMLLGFNILN